MVFDRSSKSSVQVDNVVRRPSSSVFSILRNVKCSDERILLRLYRLHKLPHLEYCLPAWSPHLRELIQIFERVQHVFTRRLWYRLTSTACRSDVPCYRQRLVKQLKLLQERSAILELTSSFRILTAEIKFLQSKHWVYRPSSAGRGVSIHYSMVIEIRHILMPSNVFSKCASWFQLLPSNCLQSSNSSVFKSSLEKRSLS